jgi:hypothetical protein
MVRAAFRRAAILGRGSLMVAVAQITRWTPSEEEELRALIFAAKDVEAIARELNRTPLAVRHRAGKLGLTFRKIERRGRPHHR